MKILVLGAGGMLGHKMYQTLSLKYPEVWAHFKKDFSNYEKYSIFNPKQVIDKLDLGNKETTDKILNNLKPDVIINCAGITPRKTSHVNPSEVIIINSVLPHRLKEWWIKNSAFLFHFSSDCVFSGQKGSYRDESLHDAKDLNGRSKSLGEVSGPHILTLRSSIFGLELENKTELLEWFLANKETRIEAYRKWIFSGISSNFLSRVVLEMLMQNNQLQGIYQIAGESINKYDFLFLANRLLDNKCEIVPSDDVIVNKSLNGERFRYHTGIITPSWKEMLTEIAEEKTWLDSRIKTFSSAA